METKSSETYMDERINPVEKNKKKSSHKLVKKIGRKEGQIRRVWSVTRED